MNHVRLANTIGTVDLLKTENGRFRQGLRLDQHDGEEPGDRQVNGYREAIANVGEQAFLHVL
jgi:hypothetical protein